MPPVGKVILQPIWDGERKYRVVDDIIYTTLYGEFVVPSGFITDLASIPRILRSAFPHDGKYLEAAIIHDWLYANDEVDRKTADKIFRNEMKRSGVSACKRNAFYWTVRLFGGAHKQITE